MHEVKLFVRTKDLVSFLLCRIGNLLEILAMKWMYQMYLRWIN